MPTSRVIACLVLALVLATAFVQAAGDTSQVLDYTVKAKGEKIGWSKAVIEDTPEGRVVNVKVKIATEVLGQTVSMITGMKTVYDSKGLVSFFSSRSESPKGKLEIEAKRLKSGAYEIVRTKDGEAEKLVVSAKSFDVVSVDPAIFAGEVGSKKKMRMLFTSSGEIRKVSVTVLDRKEKLVMGETTTVTHFKVKGTKGTVEEWRTPNGVLLRSNVGTPLGKIVIQLMGHSG